MLAIRLTRQGAKKRPFYRIIVTEKRSKRDGRFIEILGHYNPLREPIELKLDQERVAYWMKCGAQPSDTVRGLIRKNAELNPVAEPVAAAPAAVEAAAPTATEAAAEPATEAPVAETTDETAAE